MVQDGKKVEKFFSDKLFLLWVNNTFNLNRGKVEFNPYMVIPSLQDCQIRTTTEMESIVKKDINTAMSNKKLSMNIKCQYKQNDIQKIFSLRDISCVSCEVDYIKENNMTN